MPAGTLRKIFLLFFFLIFLFSSCVKDVTNIKLPDASPKLVVGCFISPQDTVLVATVTKSVPYFGSKQNSNTVFQKVSNALVKISDGTNSGILSFNTGDSTYKLKASQFSVLPAKTYYLTVSTPDGSSVSASCTVPLSSVPSMSIHFIDTVSSFTGTNKEIDVSWQDIPNQTNYYVFFAQEATLQYSYNGGGTGIVDTLYNNLDTLGSPVFTNQGRAGSAFTVKIMWQDFYSSVFYDFYVLNISQDYYQYLNSISNFNNTSGDPFGTPSPVFTNVKGGLGIFTAFQKLHVRKM